MKSFAAGLRQAHGRHSWGGQACAPSDKLSS